MIKCRIMEFKRSTFQLGLQAINVTNQRKIITSNRTALFISKPVKCRVSIRKTFAQVLRNETQNFSFFEHQFFAKKQQFAQSFAKVISAKLPYSAFAKLKFWAIRQFRKNQWLVTVCVSQNSILEKSCFGIGNWSLLHN